ncbi:MAG TPA: hypothetical protein VD932_01055 [Aquabacterium sp.]|nr:hypothetical protein [Aquabacterium sp.]
MASDTFTLAEIVARTGAKRRTVQLWADGGVLLSVAGTDRAGTGTSRQFYSWEVEIAALLVPLAEAGIQIGRLLQFSALLRSAILVGHIKKAESDKRIDVSQLLTGNSKSLLSAMHQETARWYHYVDQARSGIGKTYFLFAHTPEKTTFNIVSDAKGYVTIDPALDFPQGEKDRPLMIILDATKLLHKLLD